MSVPRPRPLVIFESGDDPDRVVTRFVDALRTPPPPVIGTAVQRHVNLHVHERERHFWSPWLSLEIVERDGGGAVVRGRFGPHPSIWTAFVFTHFLVLVLGLFGTAYGYAQHVIEEPAWALWCAPGAVFLHAFVFGAEFIGKGLGSEQMFQIRDFVRDVVGAGEPDRRPQG